MSKLPVVTELPIDGRTGNFSLPWRQWLQTVDRALGDAGTDSAALAVQVATIATALGSPDGTVENIPDQDSLDVVIYGRNGVTVTGKAGVTPVYVELEPVEDDGTGALLAVTLDSYGRVIGSRAATITGTANRITVTNGTAASGLPTLDIAATYVGQTSLTTLGTISTGTWQGTAVAAAYGGTGQTSYTTGDLLYASGATTLSKLAAGTATHVLTSNGAGAAPSWQAVSGAGAGVGAQIGYARTVSTTTATTTDTTIPFDATIPQITEGVAYPSLDTTITPNASTSLLEIEVMIPVVSCSTAVSQAFALFRDSGANAIAAVVRATAGSNQASALVMRTVVTAGSTSATTFKLRWATQSGTAALLNPGGTNFFGTADVATMTIREIKQ